MDDNLEGKSPFSRLSYRSSRSRRKARQANAGAAENDELNPNRYERLLFATELKSVQICWLMRSFESITGKATKPVWDVAMEQGLNMADQQESGDRDAFWQQQTEPGQEIHRLRKQKVVKNKRAETVKDIISGSSPDFAVCFTSSHFRVYGEEPLRSTSTMEIPSNEIEFVSQLVDYMSSKWKLHTDDAKKHLENLVSSIVVHNISLHMPSIVLCSR
jgi:hypothetical protein